MTVTHEDGEPIDINVLDAQRQKPGFQTSETIATEPSETTVVVAGPDDVADEPQQR